MVGVEAGGEGLNKRHAATLSKGSTGILHGMKSVFLQDGDGQITPAFSISAGLDYPGIGPEHAYLHAIKRVHYEAVTDEEALSAFKLLTRLEGIIPAMESAHALAYAAKFVPATPKDALVVINLSGRGDKDVERIADMDKEDAS